MTYIFDQIIENQSVGEFFATIQQFEDDEQWTVYFTSPGGSFSSASLLIDFVNKQHQRFEFIVFSDLHSAAFLMLQSLKCSKRVLKTAWSVLELSDMSLSARELKNSKSLSTHLQKVQNKNMDEELYIYGEVLSTEEVEVLRNGGNIYLEYDRLKKIFNAKA